MYVTLYYDNTLTFQHETFHGQLNYHQLMSSEGIWVKYLTGPECFNFLTEASIFSYFVTLFDLRRRVASFWFDDRCWHVLHFVCFLDVCVHAYMIPSLSHEYSEMLTLPVESGEWWNVYCWLLYTQLWMQLPSDRTGRVGEWFQEHSEYIVLVFVLYWHLPLWG